VLPGRRGAGLPALNMNRLGDMPIFAEIQEHVIDAGLAAGDGTNLGNVLYTRGMYAAMLAAEAARTAQEIHGTADITPR
jgi:branched-chain amino acid transport system substrate-binding protein